MREAVCWLLLGRRAAVMLVACSAALVVWRAWSGEPVEPSSPRPTYRYIPLLGDPLLFAVDEADGEMEETRVVRPSSLALGGCLPFLPTVVERPGWQLQFVVASSGCMGEARHDHYVLDSSGVVTWTRPNLPVRTLALLPGELARVRQLDRLDCVRTEPVGYGEWFYRVAFAGIPNAEGGAHISGSSVMAGELEAIFEAAKTRYREHRLAALAPLSVRLRMGSRYKDRMYGVDIVGSRLTIRRHARILHHQQLEPADLVELVDRLAGPDADPETHYRGWLRTGDVTNPVALEKYTRGEFWDPVQRAVDEVAFREDAKR
ncbi:MAG: hypothetical protein WKG01_30080 [Kofleriaceae bacterium]